MSISGFHSLKKMFSHVQEMEAVIMTHEKLLLQKVTLFIFCGLFVFLTVKWGLLLQFILQLLFTITYDCITDCSTENNIVYILFSVR